MSLVGNAVCGGFGGICDSYNFTGYIVCVDTESGKVKSIFATIAGPDSIPQNGTWQGGGVSFESLVWCYELFWLVLTQSLGYTGRGGNLAEWSLVC